MVQKGYLVCTSMEMMIFPGSFCPTISRFERIRLWRLNINTLISLIDRFRAKVDIFSRMAKGYCPGTY